MRLGRTLQGMESAGSTELYVMQSQIHARLIGWDMWHPATKIYSFANPFMLPHGIVNLKLSITAPVAWECLERLDGHRDTALSHLKIHTGLSHTLNSCLNKKLFNGTTAHKFPW